MKRSYQQNERKRRLRWKSYVLQEAEACAREAKMAWATREGIRVMNLQHDGIITGSLGGRQRAKRWLGACKRRHRTRAGTRCR